MEKELEGLSELPQVLKEGNNGEFLAINVEEEKDAPKERIFAKIASSKEIVRAKVRRRWWETKKYTNRICKTTTTAELLSSVKKNLSLHTSRDSSPISIYKVPAKLREVNEEAYTPRSVSIGPIHHGRPELKAMQRYKWRFLDRYLKSSLMTLNVLIQAASDMENEVRQCYQEPFDNLSSTEFSEMIMLDGIFVTVLLLEEEIMENSITEDLLGDTRTQQVSKKAVLLREKARSSPQILSHNPWVRSETKHDFVLLRQEASSITQISHNRWVRSEIIHDLMLLENQLPFFVLQEFCRYMKESDLKLYESIPKFFLQNGNMEKNQVEGKRKPSEARHLVDFLRNYYEPKQYYPRGKNIVYNRSATELQEAGVDFKGVVRPDIFEIQFVQGKLEIPIFRVDEHTETLFRNLIAFEQCRLEKTKDISSYVIFMDSLIDSKKDVDLLVDCGVIHNFYGDHERVATLFNNLHKHIVGHENDFFFEKLCTDLNVYSKDYWHQLKAKWFRSKKVLRRDYFNTPWSTLSVITAVILLVLTMVQTICSILSLL